MFVADFHIHSKYSRATSKNMNVPELTRWAKYKGIQLLGTGDFTHHLWLQEIQQALGPDEKNGILIGDGVSFILSGEISNIYSQNGKGYRVHNIIMVPSLALAREVNRCLSHYGNLASDGRPILGMSCRALAAELAKISEDIMLIPAHIWTPWFSVFGSKSGFNSLEEAFGKYTGTIAALETGLSSDPAMNWRLSKLDEFSLISNSDSHSPQRIGREANVFDCEVNYWEIRNALKNQDKSKFLYTVEFFPEEGKYHYDGHRNCQIRFDPHQTRQHRNVCPVCHKQLTRGVLSRVDELADREMGYVPPSGIAYKSLIPLDEIIGEAKGVSRTSKAVEKEYLQLVQEFGSEFNILVNVPEEEFSSAMDTKIVEGIRRVRQKQVHIEPGFDGEYGTIKIFDKEKNSEKPQMTLF